MGLSEAVDPEAHRSLHRTRNPCHGGRCGFRKARGRSRRHPRRARSGPWFPRSAKASPATAAKTPLQRFRFENLKTLSKIKVGKRPDAIWYDSATKRVLTFNAGSQDSTAIDAAERRSRRDHSPRASRSSRRATARALCSSIWKTRINYSPSTQINLPSRKRWPLAGCEEPSGLAIDTKKRRLFVGCGNKVMPVVDANTGKILATIPIGDGVDATAFDEETGLASSPPAVRECL
mgnify:CR=1 FL=1